MNVLLVLKDICYLDHIVLINVKLFTISIQKIKFAKIVLTIVSNVLGKQTLNV